MEYILLMTSAGSFLFTGCLLLIRVLKKHMDHACRYWMLVTVMFTYLVPWVWLKAIYGNLKPLVQARKNEVTAASGNLTIGNAVFHATDRLVMTSGYSFMMLAVGVWLGIAVILMLVKGRKYLRNKNALLECVRKLGTDVPEELVQRMKQEFRIKRRIIVVQIPGDRRSFTLGAFRPVVFLQKSCKQDEMEHILRHEFTHIVRGDLLVKMLMELVCCLHWFNPLVYRLNRRLENACEQACDERVIRQMSEAEQLEYVDLIIKSVTRTGKKAKEKVLFGSFWVSDTINVTERLEGIMKKQKRKIWEKIVVAGAFALLLFVDSLTAMAYPQVFHVKDASMEVAEVSVRGEAVLLLDSEELLGAEADGSILYDRQIVTADGEILPVQAQSRVLCFHSWQDAKYQTHDKNDNGGCTVKIYACKYCSKCDTIKMGELLQTNTYTTCTHN